MNDTAIRASRKTDLETVSILNEGAVPNVNSVSVETLERFMRQAAYFRVVESGKDIVAFLVGFAPGAEYDSENYRWFCRRYSEFMYIDRIAVAPEHRGRGLALSLYRDMEQYTAAPLLACEVNLRPPNPRSLEFHRRFGFQPVGRQETEGGAKTVSLMIKSLPPERVSGEIPR